MASPSNYTSVVDFLKSRGIKNPNFAYRKNLAKELGIQNYTGTAKQNRELITKISNSNSLETNSIVDLLKSKGLDSSFANRKKLAEGFGIQNYTGTASQNISLIKKINSNESPGIISEQDNINDETDNLLPTDDQSIETTPSPLDVENERKKEAEQIKSDKSKIIDIDLSAIENATPGSLKAQGNAKLSRAVTALGKKLILLLIPIAIDVTKQFINQIADNEIKKLKEKASQEQQNIQNQIDDLKKKIKDNIKGSELEALIKVLTAKKEAIPVTLQIAEDNLRAQLANFGSFAFDELPKQIVTILKTIFADGCPNPNDPLIKEIITIRNNLVTSLNLISKQLNTLTSAVTGLSTFSDLSQKAVDALKLTKISTSLAIKAVPSPPGVPGIITSALSDLETVIINLLFEKDGIPRLPKIASAIASAVLSISLVNVYIQQILGILSALDIKLKQCVPDLANDLSLTPISNDLISIAAQQTQADDTINQVTYAGFLIEIEEVPYTPTVNRRRAVGKNQSGIILIQTELSFTTQDEILINELKLIIDRDNLKAY
jgi:hypothetical protein